MVSKHREIKRLISEGAKDIVTFEDYAEHKELYANTKTAIEVEDKNGVMLALPYRAKGDGRPGIYDEGVFSCIIYPEEENSIYVENSQNVINLSDSKNINEYMEKQEMLKDLETESLTSPDNIFEPPLLSDDTEEMRGFKEALISKHFDFDKYEPRFGKNFPNEKRLVKGNKISIEKLKYIGDRTDMDIFITFKDKNPDVPNPIGKTITKRITSEGLYNDI